MKVLVAPDGFSGTLSAPEAARAIADGWRTRSPGDELTLLPMSDGGPGFVDSLHAVLGGELHVVTVPGPAGESTPVTLLQTGDVVHVEAAQACGQHLLDQPAPWSGTSAGVGAAVAAAIDAGARTVVVGTGGTATLDGGAGLLGALGATADVALDAGPRGLRDVRDVDLSPARERLGGVRLVAATDIDLGLLGMFGATKALGPDRGLDESDVLAVDAVLDAWVETVCGSTPAERRVADAPGAGAGGGLGLALLLLGAEVRPGVELVGEAIGLQDACVAHDLVLSGEGRYDHTSRTGKVVHGIAGASARAARPCVVLAGEVTVGAREMRAMGVESAYSVVDAVGLERALGEPATALAELAQRVARTWAR